MEQIKKILAALSERLTALGKRNAVVARPLSVGDRHVIPLCELAVGVGAGGGTGEGKPDKGKGPQKGTGGGAGGGAKAVPVAVVVIEGGKVRLESFGL